MCTGLVGEVVLTFRTESGWQLLTLRKLPTRGIPQEASYFTSNNHGGIMAFVYICRTIKSMSRLFQRGIEAFRAKICSGKQKLQYLGLEGLKEEPLDFTAVMSLGVVGHIVCVFQG